ncbi:MAG: hypothetical protein MI685_01925 [Chlorobiales bacterium]|nr:hypothetical protein [Chlorobiales bacterium]
MFKKSIYICLGYLFFFVASAALQSCEKKQRDSQDKNSVAGGSIVYVYYDITEGLSDRERDIYLNDVGAICELMGLDSLEMDGGKGYGKVHINLINHENYRRPMLLKVEDRNEDEENEKICRAKVIGFINGFRDSVKIVLNKFLTERDTAQTVITKKFINDLHSLKETSYKNKIMVVYSDMVEHNNDIGGVSFIDTDIVQKGDDFIKDMIENAYKVSIKDSTFYNNVSIYIVRPDHEKYFLIRERLERFWKNVFGASCKFQNILDFE